MRVTVEDCQTAAEREMFLAVEVQKYEELGHQAVGRGRQLLLYDCEPERDAVPKLPHRA